MWVNTPYSDVFDVFIRKLKNDTTFFQYRGLDEAEINEIVGEHLLSLLGRAIDKLYSYGLPDVDFYDRDDDFQTFNIELTKREIGLISDLMYLCYLEEDRNKLKAVGMRFRTSELNMLFSPANDRRTFMQLLESIELNLENSISNYFSRDRLTWEFKSIYGR